MASLKCAISNPGERMNINDGLNSIQDFSRKDG